MQLDAFTLLVACCSLLVLLGALLLAMWVRDRRESALLWWAIPFILGGAALTLYVRPGWETDVLAICVGNISRLVAVGSIWQGVRVFNGRRPLLLPVVATCVLWIVLCGVPAVIEVLALRIAIVSALTAALCGLSAHELWRNRSEALASRRPLTLIFVSLCLIMLTRMVISGVAPFPVGGEPVDAVWLGAFMLVLFGHAAFGGVLFITMIKERGEAEQRNFAMSDPLTGLLNRRAFADYASARELRGAAETSASALLVLDLDHFKAVNDRYGHEVGDRILKAFAEVAKAKMRPTDQLFRMGGEEFCFVLPDCGLPDAIAAAERLREAVAACTIETTAGPAHVTVSIGVAAAPHAVDTEVVLAAADAAVYEAKARGRNRVAAAEPSKLLRVVDTATLPPRRTA